MLKIRESETRIKSPLNYPLSFKIFYNYLRKWKSKTQRTEALVLGIPVHIKGLMLLSLKLMSKFPTALMPAHSVST